MTNLLQSAMALGRASPVSRGGRTLGATTRVRTLRLSVRMCRARPTPTGTRQADHVDAISGVFRPTANLHSDWLRCHALTDAVFRYLGEITATTSAPYHSGGCLACDLDYRVDSGACVACTAGEANAVGDTLADGNSLCDVVACPPNSTGSNLATGCNCSDGYAGSITATTSPPYYAGQCSLSAAGAPAPPAELEEESWDGSDGSSMPEEEVSKIT